MTSPPVDQAARDRILRDLDSTLFVEAGAGTGKTTSLVGRIVRLVASGRATADKVAAITFTEAAAAELRDRVRAGLEKAAADAELPVEERERCRGALDSLDAAAMETLHAFAGRILSIHPLEAGLPPGFQMLDEVRAATLFDESWASHLQEMLSEASLEEPLHCLFALGVSAGALGKVARQLHHDWERVRGIELDSAPLAAAEGEMEDLGGRLADLCSLRTECTNADDAMAAHLASVEAFASRLEIPPTGMIEQIRLLESTPRLKTGRAGRKGSWPQTPIQEIRDEWAAIQAESEVLKARLAATAMVPVIASLRDFVVDQADVRRCSGQVEFHDLLVRARDLLESNADVRAAVRNRFTYVLIDEFQDTDPVQTDIARLLASSKGGTSRQWGSTTVDAGRLFFVGDPKQSIYRFRRADIVQYQNVQEQVAPAPLRLTQSFRSVPAIAEWVNAVFAPLMGTEAQQGQAAYVAMDPYRPAHPEGVTVRMLGEEHEEKSSPVRAREAREVVGQIRSAKADAWQVRGDDDTYRDARYQDIAVLVPTRTSVPALERELEHQGVPYRLESQALVYQTQEVRDLLSVLRTIDNPTDQVALVAALRSPGFGVADDELARWAEAGGGWDYRQAAPTGEQVPGCIRDGMGWLAGLHERRWWQTVSETVEQTIRERRLMELATFDRRPRQRWQRLRFVQDQARAFLDGGGRTLRQFLVWTERQAEQQVRVRDSVVPETDDDAVRVMTIHASKGLEFPIVVLTGLNSAPRRNQTSPVLWDADGSPEISFSAAARTAGYEDAKARDEELGGFEQIRLLYVAATRARDHLIVSVHRSARNGLKTRVGLIDAAAQDCPHLWISPDPFTGDLSEAAGPDPQPAGTAMEREAWIAGREAAIERLRSAQTMSATGIAKLAAEGNENLPDEDATGREDEPWRRGRAGTAIGRAVHSTLQTVDLGTGEGLAETALAQAVVEGVAERSTEIQRLAKMAIESDVVLEAVENGRFWREMYVGASIEGTTVEGFVDLLYEGPHGYVVVDYKTDAVRDAAEVASALERYRSQGAAYALVLEEALGVRVARCVFLFLTQSGAVAAEIDDLRAAVNDVRDLAAGTSLADSTTATVRKRRRRRRRRSAL